MEKLHPARLFLLAPVWQAILVQETDQFCPELLLQFSAHVLFSALLCSTFAADTGLLIVNDRGFLLIRK